MSKKMIKIEGTPEEVYKEIGYFFGGVDNIKTKKLICYIGEEEIKEAKTRYQEQFYYGLFGEIGNFLGETKYDVKMYFLAGCFGVKRLKLSNKRYEFPKIHQTRDLTKKQAIFLISILLNFIIKHNIPCKYKREEIENFKKQFLVK